MLTFYSHIYLAFPVTGLKRTQLLKLFLDILILDKLNASPDFDGFIPLPFFQQSELGPVLHFLQHSHPVF